MNSEVNKSCKMCGAQIVTVARKCRSCGEPLVHLSGHSWLRRTIEVAVPAGTFSIDYSGRGVFDAVWVRPGTAVRKFGATWFVPRFDFNVGGHAASIDVRVWPWLLLRSFVLRVDGEVLYWEPDESMTMNKIAIGD